MVYIYSVVITGEIYFCDSDYGDSYCSTFNHTLKYFNDIHSAENFIKAHEKIFNLLTGNSVIVWSKLNEDEKRQYHYISNILGQNTKNTIMKVSKIEVN